MTIEEYSPNLFKVIDENNNEFIVNADSKEDAINKTCNIHSNLAKLHTSNYKELRLQEYPPTNELIVALWEKLVEGKNDGVEALQRQRLAVKDKYPK